MADYQFSETCYEYLDKMVGLCAEKGVQLVLIKAPSLYPYWYDEWDRQMEEHHHLRRLIAQGFLQEIVGLPDQLLGAAPDEAGNPLLLRSMPSFSPALQPY